MTNNHSDGRAPFSLSIRARVLGIGLTAAGLALYIWLVGGSAVIAALWGVSLRRVARLVLAGFIPILLWGISLRVVLTGVGVAISVTDAVLLFLASVFLNNVTPFGQAGGDPPSGLLIAHVSDAKFEAGLAAIVSVNALNHIALVLLGVVGATWLTVGLAALETLREVIVLTVTLAVVSLTVATFLWIRRDTVVQLVGGAIAVFLGQISRRLPFVSLPSRASIIQRVHEFVTALERLSAHPRRIAAVFLLGVAGQVIVAGILWCSLVALKVSAPIWVVVLVVPAAKVGGLAPLTGGTGGTEVLLSGLLVATTDVTVPIATAAALLYRATVFWIPTMAGGIVTAALLMCSTDA